MQDSHDKIIILLFTFAQIALIFILGYTPYPDSDGYIALGSECAAQGSPYPLASKLTEYAFLWNSGSINAVAASWWLTGSVIPLQILYALMKGATAWLLYDTTRHLFLPTVARLTLFIYICYPANYGEATSVLSEVPFIFFAMAAVWMCVRKQWFLAAGTLLAVGNWMRPFSVVFLASLIIFLRFRWRHCSMLLGGYILTIVIIGTLSMARTGLFLYQAKSGWMALTQYSVDHDSTPPAINPEAVCSDTTLNVSQKDDLWRTMFFNWLSENKTDYLRQMPAKLANTYVSDNVNLCAFLPAKTERKQMYDELSMGTLKADFPRFSVAQWLTLLNLLFYYLLLITAMLSLRTFNKKSYLLPLSVIVTGTLMLLLVGHGEARFHQPFMPFFIMLAASFIHSVKNFKPWLRRE